MGTQNFDVEFEDYIIFHRGVQEVFFNTDDNHLHVIYQDGYDQDLGDPLGDRVTSAEAAGAYAAQVEAFIRSKESEIRSMLDSATELSTDANAKYERTLEIGNTVQEAKEYVDGQIDYTLKQEITGISKNEETGKYYVNLSNYSTTDGVKTLISNDILKINGVETYEDAYGNSSYYLNPIKDNSKTTTEINNMINSRLQGVNGINWNPDKQKYEIDISDDAITAEEIHTLFS